MVETVAIVTLVYREPNIIQMVQAWKREMPDIPIFIFADGCDDQTLASLEYLYLCGDIHYGMVPSRARKGYPKAAREAIIWMRNKTDFDWILFTDSDGCYSPESIRNVIETGLRENMSISGYRPNRRETWFRMFYIKMESKIMRILFGMKMKDFTAVCRMMKTDVAAMVASQTKYSKYGYWMEWDAVWHSSFDDPKEIPTIYTPQPSKIYALRKMPKILWTEFWAIIKTRLRLWNLLG